MIANNKFIVTPIFVPYYYKNVGFMVIYDKNNIYKLKYDKR